MGNNGVLSNTITAFSGAVSALLATISGFTEGSVIFSKAGTLGEDNANLFWDDTNNFMGIGMNVPVSKITLQTDGLNTTQTNASGLTLANSTAATAIQGQISPGQVYMHNVWHTSLNSIPLRWRTYAQGFANGTNPYSVFYFQSSVGAAGYIDAVQYVSDGTIIAKEYRGNANSGTKYEPTLNGTTTSSLKVNSEERLNIIQGGDLVINETALDRDTRIEGVSDANAFYVDASANTVQIGNATTVGSSKFYVHGVGGVRAGSSTSASKLGGALFNSFADAGNGTTVETDLYSYTIPASTLAVDGDKLESHFGGTFVSSGTATRQIKIYFGGTVVFDSGALTLSLSAAWSVETKIIRVSSSVVRCVTSLTTQGAALSAYTAYTAVTGLTLTNTQILKITGQAAGVGAATGDITAKIGQCSWISAA